MSKQADSNGGVPLWVWIAGGAAVLAGGVYLYLLSGRASTALEDEPEGLLEPLEVGAVYQWHLETPQPVGLSDLAKALERHFPDVANLAPGFVRNSVRFDARARLPERRFPFTLNGVPGKLVSAKRLFSLPPVPTGDA